MDNSGVDRLFEDVSAAMPAEIAIWAFILNAVWEFGHAGPLYDMWSEVSLTSGLFHITIAILGDVLIVFAVSCVVGVRHVLPPELRGAAALPRFGLIAGTVLERLARSFDWWTYNERMPTIDVLGDAVGLSPVMQIALLPALSVYLAFRIPILRRKAIEYE